MLGGVGKPNKIITRIKSVFIRDQFPSIQFSSNSDQCSTMEQPLFSCGYLAGCRVVFGGLGVVSWNRVILGSLGVVNWGSVGCAVILRCLGGVVLVALDGVISWSLGIVAGIGGVLVGLGVVTGCCACCCLVRRRRCGLVSSILMRHR
jgi:hypothetical protein